MMGLCFENSVTMSLFSSSINRVRAGEIRTFSFFFGEIIFPTQVKPVEVLANICDRIETSMLLVARALGILID